MIKRIAQKLSSLRQKRDLTVGSISKNIWILALPLVVGNFLQSMFNLVDMFWVGRLGPSALAAVAMSGSIMMILFTMVIGLATGTTAMVSRFIGAKKTVEAAQVAAQSINISVFGSIFIAVLGYVFAGGMLKLLGAPPDVLRLGSAYLQIIFLGSFSVFFFFIFFAVLRGSGDAVTPTLVLMFCTLINIVLDPLLIFGIGPFPRMGVAGAALATILSQLVGVAIGLEILLRGRSHLHLHIKYFKVNWDYLYRIIKIGIPSSLQMSLRGIMGVILMAIVAWFGTFAIAAYGVVFRLIMVLMMPGFALADASAILVGQNLGAQKPDRAERSAWTTAFYYMGFMIMVGCLGFIFAPSIMRVFNPNVEVVKIGTDFMRIAAFSYVFTAFGIVLGRSMSGAGDTISPLILTFIALWVIQIPLAVILSKSMGLRGIWFSFLIANSVNGIITILWFKVGKWKHKKV
ncbi:MAG: MATE family efflux transporter [Candidatus Margulisbacteria bacterium]|nr:MATE family efflux transporter [Candidatus Margulisiibacteriota bacterium]MBU1021308.1 MATE family efflux transporter [Candidatus Margulisiibacteriota bacterium]MBU1729203.1 MATE family efflux transporter [Candidatus Margulisiibacteriota bacterium]MBU1954876.1 MATE family efflux transporter [Candidatus Margulisiibacteriota bacterium]